MAADLLVDLFSHSLAYPSLPSPSQGADAGLAITSGGCVSSLSGVQIGDSIDLNDVNHFTNVYVEGRSFGSGPLLIGVQDSPDSTSGNFTDPTSGLAQFPTWFRSGGWLIIGSGPATATNLGIAGSGLSGQIIQSGFMTFGAFQRKGRWARLVLGSGFYDGTLRAGFIAQRRVIGSGTGYSVSPSSGILNV